MAQLGRIKSTYGGVSYAEITNKPISWNGFKKIRVYIAEDNPEYAAKTIKEIYGKFE